MTTSIRKNIAKLIEERGALWDVTAGPRLADVAMTRDFTKAETIEFEAAERTVAGFNLRIKALEDVAQREEQVAEFTTGFRSDQSGVDTETRWINTDTGRPAALRSGDAFLSHEAARSREDAGDAALSQFGNVGDMVRALATAGTGSQIVPTTWSGNLIDLARSKSAVAQAGATIIPMNAKTVNIGRLTGDPTATFRAEGSSVTASDPTFDNVTLSAKTQSALVTGSLEWFQDADNADAVVSDAIANAIAQNLDLNALYGGIVAGAGALNLPTPPNPRGILAALNALRPANVLGAATNGTTQSTASYWGELIDLIYTVRDGNEEPNALIWSSKLGRGYSKAVDTTGQPLQMPADIASIKRLTVNKVPSYTQGNMTTATDAFAGDFSQLLIGQRLGLTLQVLTERFADTGTIGIVAHWRGDVQPARPSAFAVYRGLKGA